MPVSLGLVHHANQYLITNGYDSREGIAEIIGSEAGQTGMLGAFAAHEAAGIPLNLHISGTLLEAVAWHSPSALRRMRGYFESGLIEIVGSCYGQNIMRFFGPDYNLQQLNEELRLFDSLLGVPPAEVKVFWPPERVWETRRMAPLLRDATLLNDGYRYVVMDDRTLLSPRDRVLPRGIYDRGSRWSADVYQACEIEAGLGLVAIPISIGLRHSIPPKKAKDWQRVQTELEALLIDAGNGLAVYADDMEKVIGVWGADGPPRYTEFLRWIAENSWVQPVKLTEWARANPPAGRRKIETGTFAELAKEFKAGEGYENWFYSEGWAPYRKHFKLTERRVKQCKTASADNALIELAEKQLLVSNWETAWHTPATGAHGDPANNGNPSPWARALTSHCRHALVTAEAACWMKERDGNAHATVCDVDSDGEPDLVLKNEQFFGLVSKRWGGRLVALYHIGGTQGAMVVGNPCDDWNFLEDLNSFMKAPRNHPGAFADVGYENDRYACTIVEQGNRVLVRLRNIEKRSRAKGLEKIFEFRADESAVTVQYRLPAGLKKISIECALSPNYLTLLRHGAEAMKTVRSATSRGFRTGGVSIVLEGSPALKWETPIQEVIGHARTLRMGTSMRQFQLKLKFDRREVHSIEEKAV